MHIAYIGNFEPSHSTENDIKSALENLGHDVRPIQEGGAGLGDLLIHLGSPQGFYGWEPLDLILWTRTASLSSRWDLHKRWQLLRAAAWRDVPTVGYHLDRWWGLSRQHEVYSDPFFKVDLLCTADGGHQIEWERDAWSRHHWMPPAIAGKNVGLGTPREEYASDVAFVGNWQGGYHHEWKHRDELVHWLERTFGKRVAFWPKRGQHAVRGDDLKDLYASVKVVVGDSCLVPKADGSPMTHYCSDRIPETLGRGGILAHPSVEGIDELYRWTFPWALGDWNALRRMIETVLDNAAQLNGRDQWIANQVHFIREHHTYEVRMTQLFDELRKREMIA